MKVLFLCRYYLPHIGGVEKHVAKISQILARKHQITIITEQHDPILPPYELINNIPVYRIPANKWLIWKWFLGHLNLLFSSNIIHIHDVFFWILPFRPFLLRQKIYMTFHGYEGSDPPRLKQIFWHKLAEKLSRGNICIGDFHRKWYKVNATYVSYGAA
mgnify:CR=1 FL=1